MNRPRRRAGAVAAVGCAALNAAALTRRTPRWSRSNYRGRAVTLAAGPALAVAAVGGSLTAGAPSAALAGAVAGGLGLYDDLYGDSHARGLAGHAAALRAGRLTTGVIKLAGLVAAAAASSAMERRPPTTAAVDAVLVAGMANMVNLLDLRPGRALKASSVTASALLLAEGPAAGVAAAVSGAAFVALPADLAERAMIGDCGANTVGALLGWSLSRGLPPTARSVAAAGVVVATLASERVSFSRVIDRTPWLAAIDRWGRRP